MDISQAKLPTDAVEAVAMHCNVGGHNKDWIGCYTSSGLVQTWWGKPGQHYQTATKAMTRVQFDRFVQEKIDKGYVIVDKYEARNGQWATQLTAKLSALAKAHSQKQQTITTSTPTKTPKPPSIIKGIKPPSESISWDF